MGKYKGGEVIKAKAKIGKNGQVKKVTTVSQPYALKKNANGSGINRYGHSGAQGQLAASYHNEHFMRTGKYGKASDAKAYSGHQKKALAGAVAGLGLYGAGVLASKKSPGVGAGLSVAGTAASTYSNIESGKSRRLVDQKTNSKRTVLGRVKTVSRAKKK